MNIQKHKLTIQLICAVMLVMIGVGLLIAGFCVEPQGEIHPSVLVAYGEVCTFSGTLMGLDYRYKFKYHNKTNEKD